MEILSNRGFSMRITRGGNHLYEKFVDISEIDEIFDVGFSALWNDEWCGFDVSFETNEIEIYSNKPSFAEEHNMEVIERFYYKRVVPVNTVTSFKIIYEDKNGKTIRQETISYAELKQLWKQFKTDLLPH